MSILNSHFAFNPTRLDISRSRLPAMIHDYKSSCNVGDLIPCYIREVLPGDTVSMDVNNLSRLTPSVHPTMDSAYQDIFFFFVPRRLTWDKWQEFMGENTSSYWTPNTTYQTPTIIAGSNEGVDGFRAYSLADYFGLPLGINCQVIAEPFRAYALIWNEFFRDQNTQTPVNVHKDSVTRSFTISTDIIDTEFGGHILKANRFHDAFSSCLPSPQKGDPVEIPISGGLAPVVTGEPIADNLLTHNAALFSTTGRENMEMNINVTAGNVPDSQIPVGVWGEGNSSQNPAGLELYPSNLWVDFGNGASTATSSTVNQLRLAFQMQKILERLGRGGSRYIEIIKSFFGVTSPDARLQRPEYLGGRRMAINMKQVVQVSSTDSTSPQANVAGLSVSGEGGHLFTKSFVEHGFLIGLTCVRCQHSYQQMIEPFWTRRDRFDYYFPEFANIGDQPVYQRQLYATSLNSDPDQADYNKVFGYQEAWWDYRYHPNQITGEMRSTVEGVKDMNGQVPLGTLDSWHYGDKYTTAPTLSSAWMKEGQENMDRTLAYTSTQTHQILLDFEFREDWTRPMPVYSVPGLIDHH